MKKSKFLKKSLAMLLAVMLVVAMIPLSAAAASQPTVAKVFVNGVEATPNGSTYSAEIVDPGSSDVTVEVQLDANGAAGKVAHYIDLDDTTDAELTNGRYAMKLTAAEKAAGSMQFVTVDSSDTQSEPYTVTFTTVPASDDTAVEAVHLSNNREYDVSVSGSAYTVVANYGYDVQVGASNMSVNVYVADADAKVYQGATTGTTAITPVNGAYPVSVSDYDTVTYFTVQAADGTEATYTVTVVEPKPFASFSIDGERHTSQIDRVTEDPDFQVTTSNTNPTVEVYLPYNYGTTEFTPIFETNYSVTVTAKNTAGQDVTLVSGKTYDWADFDDVRKVTDGTVQDIVLPVTVHYSDNTTEAWNLCFDAIAQDTVAAIKTLSVDNYQATIEGNVITISLPASVRNASASKYMELGVSPETTVNVVGLNWSKKAGVADNTLTISGANVPLTTDNYTLRVTAAGTEFDADAPQTVDYELNIETAVVQDPEMTAMYLLNEKTGERIEGAISGSTITFNEIPYTYTSVDDMGTRGWKLFWTAASGCTVTFKNTSGVVTPIYQTGTKLSAVSYLPSSSDRFNNSKGSAMIDVSNTDSTKSYTIVFNSADASQDSKLGEVQLAWNNVTEYSQLNTANTIDLTVDNGDSTITGNIAYSDWNKYNNVDSSDSQATGNNGYDNSGLQYGGGTIVTTLPVDAKMYFVGNGRLFAIDELNETSGKIANALPSVGWYGSYAYGNEFQSTDPVTPLQIVVVSQAAAEQIDETDTLTSIENNSKLDGLYTVYDLTLTQNAPRTGSNLTSLSVYDAYTDTTIDASIVGNEISIELPYYFTDDYRKSHDQLYLNYTTNEGGATVQRFREGSSNSFVTLNPLVYDLNGDLVKTESIQLFWDAATEKLQVQNPSNNDALGDFEKIQVTAENGVERAEPYTLTVTVAEPENDAVLNSVTINGVTATPVGNNVTVTLPLASEVTSLAPVFNVSTNAYVVVGGRDQIAEDGVNMADPGATYNFVNPRQFTVVSEDGHTTNTYTITVEVSNRFTDVNEGDWFFEDVMAGVENGYIQGVGNGRFDPYGDITRAQFACLIARAMGFEEPAEGTEVDTRFIDVPSDYWGAAAIAFCQEQGLIEGYSNGEFRPQNSITRQEVATILARAFDLTEISDEKYVDDNLIPEWSSDAIYMNKAAGIMNGDAAGTFRPAANMNRAEAATVLMNANRAGLID